MPPPAPTADFAGQVISFRLPADAAKPAALRDASGKIIPLQTDADGTAYWDESAHCC